MIRRCLRIGWFVFSAACSVSAGMLIWMWPPSPAWRSPPRVGRLHGFSKDSTIFVTKDMANIANGRPSPVVYRWEAYSGKLLSRVEMQLSQGDSVKDAVLSADGCLALVGHAIGGYGSRDFNNWHLHDALTHRWRVGPIANTPNFAPSPFSADGRWFFSSPMQSVDGFNIYSTATGESIWSYPPCPGFSPVDCLIAPDGSTAAVILSATAAEIKGTPSAVMVIELPGGKQLRRFEWSDDDFWRRIDHWDGRYLYCTARSYAEKTGLISLQCRKLDTTMDPIGDGVVDPLLATQHLQIDPPSFWLDAPESVAYVRFLVRPDEAPTWYEVARTWLSKYVNVNYTPPPGDPVSVRVVSRKTGWTTFESIKPLGHPIMVSPSGRWLASATDDQGVAIWDTAPAPRWPWSLAAGAAVLTITWWLKRTWLRLTGRVGVKKVVPNQSTLALVT